MRYNFRGILSILSILLVFNGAFMLLCVPFSLYYGENWKPIVFASAANLVLGILGRILTRSNLSGESDWGCVCN